MKIMELVNKLCACSRLYALYILKLLFGFENEERSYSDQK